MPAVDPNARTCAIGSSDSPGVKNSDTTDNVGTIGKSYAVIAPTNLLWDCGEVWQSLRIALGFSNNFQTITISFLDGSKIQRKKVYNVARRWLA
jgi:hypothetical protein